jgi:ADP-ribosyl-[dinitrogen reductase] hydrolase
MDRPVEVLNRARTSETDPLRIAVVPVGAGLVGLTICPGKRGRSVFGASWERDLDADVRVIREWGAAAVVTLIEDQEFEMLGVQRLPKAVRDAGMEWHHLPIRDVQVPDARFEAGWASAGVLIGDRLRNGGRVLVHCRGGLGRTGIVAARLLVECAGATPQQALDAVREARPGAVETPEQETWVLGMKAASPIPDGAGN